MSWIDIDPQIVNRRGRYREEDLMPTCKMTLYAEIGERTKLVRRQSNLKHQIPWGRSRSAACGFLKKQLWRAEGGRLSIPACDQTQHRGRVLTVQREKKRVQGPKAADKSTFVSYILDWENPLKCQEWVERISCFDGNCNALINEDKGLLSGEVTCLWELNLHVKARMTHWVAWWFIMYSDIRIAPNLTDLNVSLERLFKSQWGAPRAHSTWFQGCAWNSVKRHTAHVGWQDRFINDKQVGGHAVNLTPWIGGSPPWVIRAERCADGLK